MKHCYRFFCLLLSLLLTLGVCGAAGAAENAETVIRVGWFEKPGYMEIRRDGGDEAYAGYNYAYLQAIAQHTGWTYEFVEGSFEELYGQLMDGNIDILGSVLYSRERAQEVAFPDYSAGSVYTTLFAAGDSALLANRTEQYNGISVAMVEQSGSGVALNEYATENEFQYTIVPCDTADEVYDHVYAGTADAGVVSGYQANGATKELSRFAPNEFYFCTNQNKPEVLRGLNTAIGALKVNNPYYDLTLSQQYLSVKTALAFSEKEQEYIAAARKKLPLSCGFIANRYPIAYLDPINGEVEGILRDILDLISDRSGLRFLCVPLPDDEPTFDRIGEMDVVFGVGAYRTEERLNNRALLLSAAFFTSGMVSVGRKGNRFETSDLPSYAMLDSEYGSFAQRLEGHKITQVHTYDDGLRLVRDGKADLFLMSQYAADYFLQNPRYGALSVVPTTILSEGICMIAPAEGTDPVLVSILNKCIADLNEVEISNIIMNNTTAKPYSLSVMDFVYQYRVTLFLLLVLAALLLFVVIRSFRANQRNLAKLTASNEQLGVAIARAEHASAAKGQFTSRISHEIRTPLNAIIGYITIAKNATGNRQKINECLYKSETAANHLLSILNDVLDMSSIENGKLKIAKEPFDLERLLHTITAMFYAQAQQKNIRFETCIVDLTAERVIGDGLRLNQILMNLLSNAVKFTPKGGKITLRVSQLCCKDDTIFLQFSVADTGIGMSQEFQERLFTPYEQADSSIAQRFGGSGLGLSITKNLVSMMNGVLNVKSAEGEGSVFTVELPFACERQTPSAQPEAGLSRLNALLIASGDGAESAASILRRCRVAYATASYREAEEALQEAARLKKPFDFCLIDCSADSGGAAETIRVAQRISAVCGSQKPMLLAMAYDGELPSYAAGGANIDTILAKPMFQSVLYDFLMDTFGQRKPAAQKPAANAACLRGRRLLLVEDNDMNRDIAMELLTDAGIEVDAAENGRIAVEKFLSAPERYGLILMDVQMPVMDGYQATRAIRASGAPRANTIPIIAMTANAMPEDVTMALSAGMNDHLSKPVDLKLLYQTLEKFAEDSE